MGTGEVSEETEKMLGGGEGGGGVVTCDRLAALQGE